MSKIEKKLAPKSNGQVIHNVEPVNNESKNEVKKEVTSEKKQHLSHWEKQESKWDEEHPLHFHLIPFLLELLLFIVSSLVMYLGVKVLLSNSLENQIHPELLLIVSMLIILSFATWISIFELALRRVFGIGRQERIQKAILKHEKRVERHFKHLNRHNRQNKEFNERISK